MLTNKTEIPLPVAVWLAANSDYDLSPDPAVISITTLQKPLRAIVLARRMLQAGELDIDLLVASKLGTAVHSAIEDAWLRNHRQALQDLGYPEGMLNRLLVNPEQPPVADQLAVYLEQRTSREIDGWLVSGKFDIVIDGKLYDIKTTKTYTWINGSNNRDYVLQGSGYRWLNPGIITDDWMEIVYLFSDWSPFRALADRTGYPQSRCLANPFQLMSMPQTEAYIRERLALITRYQDADDSEIPECNNRELWRDLPKWAVYKNPEKTARATRVFDLEADALTFNATSCKGQGLIVKREGKPKRCEYCQARPICSQAKRFEIEGLLDA